MDIYTRRRYLNLGKHYVADMSGITRRDYKLLEEGKLPLQHFSMAQKRALEKVLRIHVGSLEWGVVTKEPEIKITHMDPKELEKMLDEKYGDKLPPVIAPLRKRDEVRRTTKLLGENWQGKGSETFCRRGRRPR